MRSTLGGKSESGARPGPLAVEGDLVLLARARLEVVEEDEGEVMAVDAEGLAVRPSTSTSQGSSVSTQIVASVMPT